MYIQGKCSGGNSLHQLPHFGLSETELGPLFCSRDEQIIARRGLDGSATTEQFPEGGDGGTLEAADRCLGVGSGRASLRVEPTLDAGRRMSFTQAYLSSNADKQFVHAVIEQSGYFDELAVSSRRHVLAVCLQSHNIRTRLNINSG